MTEELTAVEANRRFYERIAPIYDASERCVVDERLRGYLRRELERALSEFPAAPRVLDACGGSGNASLMLHSMGIAPTTVDVSPEMLALYERTARARGFEPVTRVAAIEAFLADEDAAWDLIVFSSALHHLDDYERTLRLASERLAPGGTLLTIFDPTPADALQRRLRRLDYVLHVLLRTPGRVVRGAAGGEDAALGNAAERHALGGIDDDALRALFERLGLEVVVHDRTYDARFGLTRALYRALRRPSSFHFLVRRPAADRAA
jgi:SAM-dependent methyltransferase